MAVGNVSVLGPIKTAVINAASGGDNTLVAAVTGERIVVISYHSLEDRITKEFFKYKALDCICPDNFPVCVCDKVEEIKLITPKAVFPSEVEIKQNPRSRSARLRVAKKIVPYMEI